MMNNEVLVGLIAGERPLNYSSSSSSDSDFSLLFSNSEGESEVSTDEDKQEEEDILFPLIQILLNGRPRTRVLDFVQRALLKSDSEFREDFRITRQIYENLLDTLERSGRIPGHGIGKAPKSASLSLLMTLWFLANHSAHRDLPNLFNVSYSSVNRIVRRVVDWLVSLMPQYIVWPQGNDVQRITVAFEAKAGIANCIGAIDGSHIPINKPEENGQAYFNRKQSYSINLQAVVDCDMKFTNVYCGDPGSFHDVRVCRRSDLYHQAENNLPVLFPRRTFLLGDKGYIGVGQRWIVTPFRDNGALLAEQTDFNRRVSSTRVIVEQAFGILKARFRRLKKMELRDMDFMVRVVIACCVLHNICKTLGDNGEDLPNIVDDDDNEEDRDEGMEINDNESSDESDGGAGDNGVNMQVNEVRQAQLFSEMYPNVVQHETSLPEINIL